MFGNPKDDPWRNTSADDDWDTDPDFENTDSIKTGKADDTIVSASEAQRHLRNELDTVRAEKFGLPKPVEVERTVTYEAPQQIVRDHSSVKSWNPQQDLAGRGNVASAKSSFAKVAEERAAAPPPQRSAPPPRQVAAPAAAPPPVKVAAPPPAQVSAPPPRQVAAPPPPVKAAAPPPPVKTVPPPAPAPAPEPEPEPEQQWDDQSGGYDQGGYDQSYDQGGYDQSYDQGGYDQSYDQGSYDDGSYNDQGGYDQSYGIGQCRALYDYNGEGENDLYFKEGDVITLLNDSDPSGWWEGDLNGTVGYFPSNFVEKI